MRMVKNNNNNNQEITAKVVRWGGRAGRDVRQSLGLPKGPRSPEVRGLKSFQLGPRAQRKPAGGAKGGSGRLHRDLVSR